jgi:hypothetical protein
MGTISRFLDVFGERGTTFIMGLLEQGWQTAEPLGRSAFVKASSALDGGFRINKSSDRTKIASLAKLMIKRRLEAPLASLCQISIHSCREEIVLRYYAASGITGLTTTKDVTDSTTPPSAGAIVDAWRSAVGDDALAFALITAIIGDRGLVSWRKVACEALDSIAELHEDQATAPATHQLDANPALAAITPEEGSTEPESVGDAELADSGSNGANRTPQPSASRVQRLTILDSVFIDLMVKAAGPEPEDGAKSPEELEQIIGLFIRVNSQRFQSRFHRGFLAALMNWPLPERQGSAENDERRAWLLAGWLLGRLRDGRRVAPDELRALPEADLSTLASERGGQAAEQVSTEIIRGFAAVDRPFEIAKWLRFGSPEAARQAIDHARELLRKNRPGDAQLVASAAAERLIQLSERGRETSGGDLLAAMTVAGTASRMLGNFEVALQQLQAVAKATVTLADPSGDAEMPASLAGTLVDAKAQILLAAVRVKDVPSLWFSKNPSDQNLARTLEPIADDLIQHVRGRAPGRSGTMCYCAALWVLSMAEQRSSKDAAQGCIDALTGVIRDIQVDDAPRLTRSLLPRLVVLRALLAARFGKGNISEAIREIVDYESSNEPLPFHVVCHAIEMGAAGDASETDQLVVRRLERDLPNLVKSNLFRAVVQKPAVSHAVFSNFRRYTAHLGRITAAQVGANVFEAAIAAGADRERLGELADEMIDIVHQVSDAAENCLSTFVEKDRWQYVWDEIDFIGVRARLAQCASAEARSLTTQWLLDRAHRMSLDRPEIAEECLDLMEWLGHPAQVGDGVRTVIARRREQAGSNLRTTEAFKSNAKVLFVGGDGRQEQMQQDVCAIVARSQPGVGIKFCHPGWSSNWSSTLEAVERMLPSVDVVVMHPYMRTTFGQRLRRAINDAKRQWRTTCGHASAPSIARAIMDAAAQFSG